MSDDHSGAAHARGVLLMQQSRYGDAADYFRQALAENPQDAGSVRNLALCQIHLPGQKEQALTTIRHALQLEPNDGNVHAVHAHILCLLDRSREALGAAREAVEIDPDSTFAISMQTQALLGLRKWAEAEESARRALALDAEDQLAANQLAHALRLQNKMAENAQQVAWLLEKDPEDAQTHITAGWARLQQGDHRAAERHFLEALRLEPEREAAREGLLEAFRARSFFYRAYLAYSFKMAQLSANARWAVIVGLYVAMRSSRALLRGPYAPIANVILLLYLLFVYWVWLARPLGNVFLLLDRFARHALRREERIEAALVGATVAAALGGVVAFVVLRHLDLLFVGYCFLAAAVPLGLVFTNRSKLGRMVFGSIGALALLGALLLLASTLFPLPLPGDVLFGLVIAGLIGGVATTWIGNIPALRR